MQMEIGVLLVSFVASFMAVMLLKPVACLSGLVDKPGGRKKHKGLIPLIGGIAIYVAVGITSIFFLEHELFVRMFILAGGLIVFMGALDDRYDLDARFRLAGQLLISSIFVYGLDVHVASLGNVFGLGEIALDWVGYPFTILALVAAINAFNMMDGIDGLVGAISALSMAGMAILFFAAGQQNLAFLCLSFVGAIAAFLMFNLWGNKVVFGKVFMGDAGSMFMGLSVGVLIVYGSQQPIAAFAPTTALWLVLFPLLDMFTIMYRRVKRGRSPMAADRTHVHHIFLRAGFNGKATLLLMMLAQFTCVAFGVGAVAGAIPESLSLLVILVVVAVYQLFMMRSWRFIRWTKRRITG